VCSYGVLSITPQGFRIQRSRSANVFQIGYFDEFQYPMGDTCPTPQIMCQIIPMPQLDYSCATTTIKLA
jgi:hypothetical protein